jgi:hypothetical protein
MGWWKIDPATGKPLKESCSALSRPPDFMLLNAVPGVDNKAGAHYLGDAPWDFAGSFVHELKQVLGEWPVISVGDAEKFFSSGALPKSFGLEAPTAKDLQVRVKRFWQEIDELYRDEWDRRATEAEKRWIRDYACHDLVDPPSRLQLEANTKRGAAIRLTLSHQHDMIEVSLYEERSNQHAGIEIPVQVFAAALDKPAFRLDGQARTTRGPAERIMESSIDGERRRLKITGPSGKGMEAYVAEESFRRAFKTIRGIR